MNNEDINQFIKRFSSVRKQTIELCKPLAVEDFVAQPVADVSPPKWHLGHSTWFYEALVLENYDDDYKEFDHAIIIFSTATMKAPVTGYNGPTGAI
jgi:hypothetical protein